MARKIYKFKCDNPSCGKDVERNSREYKPKLDCKRFCGRQCLMDYNRDNKDIHNSKYSGRRANFEAKAALWLPIYQQYAHLGYTVLCEKLGGVSQRIAYDMRLRMVKKGYEVPTVAFNNNLSVYNEKRNATAKVKVKEKSHNIVKPTATPKPKTVVYREKKPVKLNRPQPTKQDDPKPTKVKDFSTGYKYVKIDNRTYKQVKIA